MAYRDDAGDAVEAPTAEGVVRAELGPRRLRLAVGQRSLEIAERFATVVEHHRRQDRQASSRIEGRLVIARDVPREGFGVWLEVEPGTPRAGMRRIFGVEPVNLLEPGGLAALAVLDRLAQRVRLAVADLAGDVVRAWELGAAASGGLDKVLVLDDGARWAIYTRRLFRDRARLALEVHADGKVVTPEREAHVRSRHGVTVVGDFVRFADASGQDVARVAIPWLRPEDRDELARRIGQWIDRDAPPAAAWPPRLPS